MNKTLWSLLLAAALACAAAPIMAQSDDNPPQVLTSELANTTLLESERLEVNFVIVDTDTITEVRIDGKVQPITPGDTVLITRTFEFKQDVTQLQVSATDEKGHTRTVNYTVLRPGVDPATVAKAEAPSKLRIFATYDARFEWDDNPSQDLSSPIKIGDTDLVGVVPDSEQADTRFNVTASGGVAKDNWAAYGGASQVSYSKADNKDFEVLAIFLGGSYTSPRSAGSAIVLGYLFTDINLAGGDYAQTHVLSPAWRSAGQTSDGTSSTLYGLDVTYKAFASDVQDDVTQGALKRDYNSVDTAQQDGYRSVYALGTASEGIKVTEFTYVSADWDWRWRWDSGLLANLGAGVQYRDYKNDKPLSTDTFLGKTRVDVPTRVSTAIGWEFRPQLRVVGRYRYNFNLSNKSPYVRQIVGVGVEGTF